MSDEFDPFHLETGLVEDYVGTIEDAIFAVDTSANGNGRLLLKLSIRTDRTDIGEGGVVTEQYPVGKEWETQDRGATCVHPAVQQGGRPRGFHESSGAGLLLAALGGLDQFDAMRAKGNPMQAKTWIGLGPFHWKRHTYEGTIDGQKSTWARMLPVEVVAGQATATAQAPKETTETAKAPETAKATGDSPVSTLPPALRGKLKALAIGADTWDEFAEQAFMVDGVLGDSAIEAIVGDEATYETLRAG